MVEDRKESIGLMEPMLIQEGSKHFGYLNDLVMDLSIKSTALNSSLQEGLVSALSSLVRSMNCYYSNLIEGHDTHPIQIERAMNEDFNHDPEQRDLQLEARAHIVVQQWLDEGSLRGRLTTAEGILEIHKRFCENLPDDLLFVENPHTKERHKVVPGEYRRQDVQVGRLVAISPGSVPRFVDRFEEVYTRLGKVSYTMAAATAHHRLLWIHPFLDGNGRVARLISNTILNETINPGGIWSISRGLARNVKEYKKHLSNCDLPKRNDMDGRGNLSEECLAEFVKFFLETCIDQVDFMADLIQPKKLTARIIVWAKEEIALKNLAPKSDLILEAMLYKGELQRSDIKEILNTGDRNARRATAMLIAQDVFTSTSTKAPLKIAFPAKLASRWMPGLFPEQ